MSAEVLRLTPTTSALSIFVSIGSTISSHASYERPLNPALGLLDNSFPSSCARYIRQSHFMFAQRHAPGASLDHALFVANSSDKIWALATALVANVNSAPNSTYYQVGGDFLPDEKEAERPKVPLFEPPFCKKRPCPPRCERIRYWYCVCQSH